MDDQINMERLIGRRIAEEFEQEGKRRRDDVRELLDAARNDATVRAFLETWEYGGFSSFEAMTCRLAVALAKEKIQLFQAAVGAMKNRTDDRLILRG